MADGQEDYRVNGDTSQPADNVRVLPVRGFTQVDNAYFDGLFGKVSPTAYLCLTYLIRNTVGYHRQGVRLSFKQLCEALDLSRNTAMRGIQELEAARIIGSDGDERGRTQVRAYFLLPIDGWTLSAPCATSANSELDVTSPNSTLVVRAFHLEIARRATTRQADFHSHPCRVPTSRFAT